MEQEKGERGKRGKTLAAIIMSGLVIVLCGVLAFAFKEYKSLIIEEQEDQLLTISKAVSNSISVYTDFYFMDLTDMDTSAVYGVAGRELSGGSGSAALNGVLSSHMNIQNEDVDNLLLIDTAGEKQDYHILAAGVGEKEYTLVNRLGDEKEGSRKIDILKDADGRFYLGLSIPSVKEGWRLVFVINIEEMYQKVASYIKVGDNGYVMIKDSTGLILMHPVEEQIGGDVITDRKKMYPDFDFTELEELVEHQKQGKEGVEIYHSYWWAQEVPSQVRKIAAYTPLWFQDDFLIVSAVIDYEEIAAPIQRAMTAISLLSIFLVFIFVLLFFQLRFSSAERKKMEKENQYLRSLNGKLEELRNKEEQMSHDQRLQMIGTLTGGIAHEFNNLLTPIMGYSGLIMAEAEGDSQLYENASEIYSSAEKAKEIIRQIASLSRKQKDIYVKPLNVREAAGRVLKIIETVKPSKVEVQTSFEWDENCFILCSETEFNQIVLNLCTNAFYAMKDEKGILKLSGKLDYDWEWGQNSEGEKTSASVIFTVEDNGGGMEAEVLAHIFDPFFTTKQVGEGTGLGLSTVQSIISSLHGSISAESTPGEGSSFTLRLPLCSAEINPELESLKADNQSFDQTGKKILLIEDDKKILKLFEKSLRAMNFEVTAISDPLEAEALLKSIAFEAVVTDYAMPKMTGADIALKVREMGLHCRVILMTGFVEERVMDYHQKQLIHTVLLKPLEGKRLAEAVAQEV